MAKRGMFGPDFSMDEIPYWIGFTAGLVITGLILREMQVHFLWWFWWLLLVFMTHFIGYLFLRAYAVYRRWNAARSG